MCLALQHGNVERRLTRERLDLGTYINQVHQSIQASTAVHASAHSLQPYEAIRCPRSAAISLSRLPRRFTLRWVCIASLSRACRVLGRSCSTTVGERARSSSTNAAPSGWLH